MENEKLKTKGRRMILRKIEEKMCDFDKRDERSEIKVKLRSL